MNEQEMMQRQKIEKREKTDIILAYILIVILLAGIGIVLYLKYGTKKRRACCQVSSHIQTSIFSFRNEEGL